MSNWVVININNFSQSHAHSAVQTFLEMISDRKTEGIAQIFEFFESCIKVRPYHSIELLQSFLRDSLA